MSTMVPAPAVDSGIVDCHFHVIGPQAQFPMTAERAYTPDEAPLRRWRDVLGPLGVTRGVIVQPSFYGTDNRALLAALAEAEGAAVGIAAVPASVEDNELDRLAAAGVRGVRMAHFAAGDPRAMGGFVPFQAFDALENRLQARGMHLQLFTDSRLLPGIAPRLRRARVPVVIDHMGRAPAALGIGHVGVETLRQLLAEGHVWVKLSGIANVSDASPLYEDARAVHAALLAANPEHLVWGSDWPHTKAAGARPHTPALLGLFREWTSSTHQRECILKRNPVRLYDMA
jgi:2-pyrone-4,6-dicarboxylate lactonase